jgi:hypothetical protein
MLEHFARGATTEDLLTEYFTGDDADINVIVDELERRAEMGDSEAVKFFARIAYRD